MQSLHILYASTSGHTEHVIDTLIAFLMAKGVNITKQRAEESAPEDLLKGDVLLLASGTWNTGGIEGQLNPHMHEFLKIRAKDIDLKEKSVAVIALGDARYRYTAKAGEHLKEFIAKHHGKILGEPLKIVNEPYGQEEKVHDWAKQLLTLLS
ncbi:hypothetical protein A3D88_03240 [Candidatus Peribacteria bacterium RIFCSPHIGHO2_02_FULL_52_16]|nr:MAG: hypothetical protein A2706_04060 [Candidatus Peribacteria bacterium RIFCSPHIGHO2_01_FULL_51_35]OGJ61347.1 MAG: hypothetical protein A3D88_03240 [Candidatus Peribacteria bacterium RIFCSPHIGHO2_02_FULL_52_16]